MSPWLRRSLIGGGVFLALGVLAIIGFYAVSAVVLLGLVRPSVDHAEYDNMTFSGHGAEFDLFTVVADSADASVPQVYVKGVTSKVWYLPELTEADVASAAHYQESGKDEDGVVKNYYHFGKTARCAFANGRLLMFSVYREDGYEFALRSNREFVKLPIDKRTMVRVFGPPKRYRESYQRSL